MTHATSDAQPDLKLHHNIWSLKILSMNSVYHDHYVHWLFTMFKVYIHYSVNAKRTAGSNCADVQAGRSIYWSHIKHMLLGRCLFGESICSSWLLLLFISYIFYPLLQEINLYPRNVNPSLAEHDMPCLTKQRRSRSVGF